MLDFIIVGWECREIRELDYFMSKKNLGLGLNCWVVCGVEVKVVETGVDFLIWGWSFWVDIVRL